MRPDIEEYLREQGWVFAGVSHPDHRRQWAQMDGNTVKRIAYEEDIEDLALSIIDSVCEERENQNEMPELENK